MKIYYLILACICNTLFRFAPFDFSFGNPDEHHTMYAVGQAASYIFLMLWIGRSNVSGKTHKIIYEIAMWCAVSNLLDELFFNPLRLGANEIVFAIIITGWTIYKARK